MKKRIYFTIITITSLALLCSNLMISSFITYLLAENVKDEVKKETLELKTKINENFDINNNVLTRARITIIDDTGEVIYDSKQVELENHLNRPEIQEAIKKGHGEALRKSDTINQNMYYYALLLDNGHILRLSMETSSFIGILIPAIIFSSFVLLAFIVICLFIAKWQANSIVKPINKLDLANPNINDIYPELIPLVNNLQLHNKMRKEFSANVSHELKTPLTSISGYAEIIANGIAQEKDIRVFAQKIYQESQNLINKINDIIKISKLDENRITLEIEEVNYDAIISKCIEKLDKFIYDKKIKIIYHHKNIYGQCIVYVMEDILYNIIQNAIKYNKQNGTVFINLDEDKNDILIKIKDTGIGIKEEELPRIYERFYRVDKSHNTAIEGSGLGLSIVKHGVGLHHGTISCDSDFGIQTTFTLKFPKTFSR
ncbi:MAG: ATP-binding protein [Erysipelotrichaceae bacterium]|nr:ATP-binding protein [Erysipelotrichaceae bacterium]MDY5251391.1 ATP-binding protein [Erysipelotrichaceae bacterium]